MIIPCKHNGYGEGGRLTATRRVYIESGGGGGGGTTQSTSYTTNVPEYAKEPFMEMIGKGVALSEAPYQPYGGERTAQFTPLQQQAFQQAGQQGTAPQLGHASGIAGMAAQQGLQMGSYQPGMFNPMSVQAPSLQNFQMGPAMQVGAQRVGTQGIQAAQTGFNPNLQQFQMEGPQSFTQAGTAEQFMNPYMQNVVDIQKREAQREADIAATQRGAQAVRAGAFGGSRQAIMDAEAERNLGQRLGDIQATGSQAAFQQAQQQFNAEQAARQQAQQANLQARLGVQELGTQTGLQTALANLSNEQQARVQSEANRLQAQGMNQESALRSALANQQAGLTVGQQNLSSLLQTQQLGSGQSMQAQMANQQALMDAQKAFEQSRQFGSNLGLQGLQTALQGAGQLGQLGQQQFGQEMDIMGARQQMGTTQQQQIQNILNQQYADFQAQRDYPYQQLGFLSDLLRGAGSSTRSIYSTPQPSALQTVAGLGTLGAGFAGAKGGEVRYADGGITGLLGDQELAQTAQNPAQGPMMQMAAQQQMAENAALRAAAPQGLPQPMVEDTVDPVEAGMIIEMQKALNEGDRQRAEALAETIEKRREERAAQEEMGIAAVADDSIGDIPEGGITGMEPATFSGGGSSGFMRDLSALGSMGLDSQFIRDWDARKRRIAEEDARKKAEAEEQRRYRTAVTEARGKASFANYLFGTPEREAEGIAELQRLREGGPEAVQAATAAATPQAIDAASVDDRRRLTNPSYRPAVPKVVDKPEDKGNAAPSGPMDQGIAAAAAPRPGSSIQDAMSRELAMQQGIAASLVQGSDEAIAAQEKEIQERGVLGEEREKRLREKEAGFADKKKEARSMALIDTGFRILAADPRRGALAAIGEGASQGLAGYKGDIKDLEDEIARTQEKLDEIADLRRQEKMADGKERRALVAQRNAAITEGQKMMYTTMSRFTDIERDEAKMVFDAAVRREIASMPSGEERLLRQLGGGDIEKGIKKMADLKAKPFNYQDAYADFLKSFKPTLPGEQPMDYRTYVSMFALPTTSGGTTSQLPKGATVLPR